MRQLLNTLGRKVLITLAVVLSFPVFLVIGFSILLRLQDPSGPWESSDCSHDERGFVASPDGKWEARLTYFSCGSPLTGYLRDLTVVAIVNPGQTPTKSAIAVEIDHEPEQQEWPINPSDLTWQGNGRLLISLPASVKMSNLKSRIDVVTIDVKRVPDRVASGQTP